MHALGRTEVALERSGISLGMLWVTPGRLLVHLMSLLVPKSSSRGGFGGAKKILFLKEVIFRETSVGVDPAAHPGIEKASLLLPQG